mgnify:CR=1 FL=1
MPDAPIKLSEHIHPTDIVPFINIVTTTTIEKFQTIIALSQYSFAQMASLHATATGHLVLLINKKDSDIILCRQCNQKIVQYCQDEA